MENEGYQLPAMNEIDKAFHDRLLNRRDQKRADQALKEQELQREKEQKRANKTEKTQLAIGKVTIAELEQFEDISFYFSTIKKRTLTKREVLNILLDDAVEKYFAPVIDDNQDYDLSGMEQ